MIQPTIGVMPPSEGKMSLFECGIPPSGGKMMPSEGGIRGVATDFLVGGGGRIVGRVTYLPQNTPKIRKTLEFGHFILESGGSTQPVFKSAGVRTPDPPPPRRRRPLGGMSPPKGRMAPSESGMPPSWADSAAPRQLCPPRSFFSGCAPV